MIFILILFFKINYLLNMEDVKIKRYKKSDKAKRNFELNGGLTKKYIRIIESRKENSKSKK